MADQEEKETLELPVEWHVPDTVISRFVTNMVVQHTEHEFLISFFEIKPPILFTEESRREIQKIHASVRADCVARVVVAPERMGRFIEVLQENWEKYQNKQGGKE